MNILQYLQVLLTIERRLAENFIKVAEYHKSEQGIYYDCQEMAIISNGHLKKISRVAGNMDGHTMDEKLHGSMVRNFDTGIDLQSDLRFLWLLTKESEIINSLLHHASGPSGENDIKMMCRTLELDTTRQSSWILSRMKSMVETVSAK